MNIRSHQTRRCLFGLLFCLLAAQPASAQPAAAPPEESQSAAPTEHFVPADQLDAVFDQTSGVLLPKAEYRRLLEQAEAARQSATGQPAEILVRAARYHVQPGDRQALVSVTLDLEQFADGWQQIAVPSGNLRLENATIGETPAVVGRQSDSVLQLFHETPGRFTVDLVFSTPLGRAGSDRAVGFELMRDATVQLQAECPAGQQLMLAGRRLQRPQPDDQPATYSLPVGSQGKAELRWTTRRDESAMDTLVFASSRVQVSLSSDTLRSSAATRVSVFGGQISQLTATVPARLEITAVESTGLESWELNDDPESPGHTRITLTWRQPFDADRLIRILGVAPLSAGAAVDIPTLVFNEVTAHTGHLVVTQEEQLRLTTVSGDGIRQLSTTAGGQSDESHPVFDYWLKDFQLAVAVRPRNRELFSQMTSRLNVTDSQASLAADVVIETLNAPLFEVPLAIPDGWQLLSVMDQAGQAVRWRAIDNSPLITVEPASPVPPGGMFSLLLEITRRIDDPTSPQQIALPVIRAPGSSLVAGRYTISSAPDLQVAPTQIRGLVPTGEDSGNIVFEAQGTEISGTLSVARKPARLSARSEIRCWMDERQSTTNATLTIDVVNGTTRQLQVRLPETTGEDLRFQVVGIGPVPGYESAAMNRLVPPRIRLVESRPDDPVDGFRLWHLTFDRRFAGSVTLTTQVRRPRVGNRLSAPTVEIPGAIHQEGLIAFEASPDQQFDEADDEAVQGLQSADPSLVASPADSSGRRIARVYQFVRPEFTAALTETRYETQPVPTAVCRLVKNVSLLSDNGKIQRSCNVDLQCIGVQTVRFTLPDSENAFLWSTILNGEAVEVRRDAGDYLVSLPTGEGKTDHVLELLFETGTAQAGTFASTQHQPVRFSIDVNESQASPIDVLDQIWQVQYPADTLLLDHDGSFHPLHDVSRPGWLQSLSGHYQQLSLSQLIRRTLTVAFILGVIGLIAALISNRRHMALKILATGAICVVLLFLLLPAVQQSREAARRSMEEGMPAVEMVGGSRPQPDYLSDDARPATDEWQQLSEGRSQLARDGAAEDAVEFERAPDLQFGAQVEELNVMPFDEEALTAPPPIELSDLDSDESRQQSLSGNGADGIAIRVPQSEAAVPSEATSKRRGSARLSVRVSLRQPGDYQSAEFRSVGANAGDLSLVMQTASQINTLRMLAAALALIGCWVLRRRSPGLRLLAVAGPALVAIALVPLAPNPWQAVLDGIVLGTAASVALWPAATLISRLQNWRCCHRSATVSLLVLLALTVPARAADEDVSADAVSKPAAPPATPGVVLPYTPGEPPLTADQVFIPREDFLRLYQLAHPGDLRPLAAPADAMVTAAFYTSDERRQVEGSRWTQRFNGRIVVRTFQDQPVPVTLPFRNVAVQSVRLNEQDAVVTRHEDELQVLISAAGLHVLDVVFDAAATIDASGGVVDLHLSDVPAGLLTFELPDENLSARVNGSSTRFRQEGRTIRIPMMPEGPLRIEWRPDTTRGTSDTIVHSSLKSTLEISDQGLTLVAVASLNCRQGSITEVEMSLPADYSIRSVDGKDVAGWTAEESDEAQRLKVALRTEITGRTSLTLVLFRRQVVTSERQSIAVPVLETLGASRSTGTVCVLAGSELEVHTESLSGVSQINPGDAELNGHDTSKTKPILAWRFNRHPAAVVIRASRLTDRLTTVVLNGVRLESERQRWTTSVTAAIHGSPRRRLDLRIPRTFLPFEVDCTDLADWYITEPTDDSLTFKTLSIQLQTARTGRVRVVIQGQDARSADRTRETFAVPQLVGADDARTQLSVWQGVATDISGFEGSQWSRISPDQTTMALQKLQTGTPGISFASRIAAPEPVTVELRRAPASVLCESVTVTNVTDTSIERTLALSWRISRSTADTFSVELPKSVAETLDFRIPGLRQEERTSLDNDRVRITFHLQYPVSDRFFAAGTGAIPLPASSEFRTIPVTFSADANGRSPMTIAGQSHFWVIVNQSGGVLEPVQPNADTDDITADQLQTSIPEGFLKQSVAIRRITEQQPGSDWRVRFPVTEETAPAVIALAQHVTVLAEDGTWRSRHTLQVRNESRQFLPVKLPLNSRPLFCLVKGRPARIVTRSSEGDVLHLIPIPQSGRVSAPFDVELGLEGTLLQNPERIRLDWQQRSIAIPVPEFPEYRDDSSLGITVARNTWSVYVPESWSATLDDDPRATNMLDADVTRLMDAQVQTAVETSIELLQAAQQSKDKFVIDNIARELSTQALGLQEQRGNTLKTEDDRANTLGRIQRYLRDQSAVQQPQSVVPQGDNMYLNEKTLQRNRFNDLNNDALIMSNSGNGLMLNMNGNAAGVGGKNFSFRILEEERSDLQRPGKSKASPNGRQADFGAITNNVQTRSQLIQNNTIGAQEQSQQMPIPAPVNEPATPDSAASQALEYRSNLPDDPFDDDEAGTGMAAGFGAGRQEFEPAVRTGLLSLQFQIPADGRRLDFVRASGNATLTLNVRSSQAWTRTRGALWAIACLALLTLILQAVRSGNTSRILRTSALSATALGTAGWILLTGVPATLALLAGIAGAIAVCVLHVRRLPAVQKPIV